jgi:hypothetical protein
MMMMNRHSGDNDDIGVSVDDDIGDGGEDDIGDSGDDDNDTGDWRQR